MEEKKKMVARYVQSGGIKGDLKQLLTSTEVAISEKSVKSKITEGYLNLVCILDFLISSLCFLIAHRDMGNSYFENFCLNLKHFLLVS